MLLLFCFKPLFRCCDAIRVYVNTANYSLSNFKMFAFQMNAVLRICINDKARRVRLFYKFFFHLSTRKYQMSAQEKLNDL